MKKSAEKNEISLKDKLEPFRKELVFWGVNKYLPVDMRAFIPELHVIMNVPDIPGCTSCKHELLTRAFKILVE